MSTKKERPPLCEAVRELRAAIGDSQMHFATRMGWHIGTIALYETKREPSGNALVGLRNLASKHNLHKLAKMFNQALARELGVPDERGPAEVMSHLTRDEWIDVQAFLMLRGWKNERTIEVMKLLEPERKLARRGDELEQWADRQAAKEQPK